MTSSCVVCNSALSKRNIAYCSKKCMYFHRAQRKEILSTFTVTCSFCNQEVKKHGKSRISSKQNYCNKSCAAKEYCNKNNIQFVIVTQNDFQVYKRYELEKDREVFFTEKQRQKRKKT